MAGMQQIADALGTTPEAVATALGTLQSAPRLSSIISSLETDKVPAAVVLLLAEEPATPFRITTQEQLNALVDALAGAAVPGPTPLPDLDGGSEPDPAV